VYGSLEVLEQAAPAGVVLLASRINAGASRFLFEHTGLSRRDSCSFQGLVAGNPQSAGSSRRIQAAILVQKRCKNFAGTLTKL
jgi:hypothetical protein